MEQSLTCTVCKLPLQTSWNFCPNCGNTLKAKPLSTSFGKQLLIYLISFFLPPFGLRYALKYLKEDQIKSKMIGVVSIILTIISISLAIVSFKKVMDYYAKILDSVGSGRYPY